MALTTTKLFSIESPNGNRLCLYNVAFDSSYPTGGETFDVSADFSGSPTVMPFKGKVASTSVPSIDVTHDGGTAAAGLLLAGYYDNDAVADGAAIQVANATNLSTHAVVVLAVGIGA